MSTLTLIVTTALLTLIVFSAGALSMRWYLRQRTPEEAKGDKRCEDCQAELPKRSYRTADGLRLCVMCKAKPR